MTQEDNLYKILGVNPSATPAEIKESYRRLSMDLHPDRGGDQKHFIKITEAYNILSDKDKRKQYDIIINLVSVTAHEVEIVSDKTSNIKFDIKQFGGSVSVDQIK